jgi:large subunit ribosomal protein L25
MKKLEITVHPRSIFGKGVKDLRRQGITPVHLFGHGIESLALQAETAPLEKLLSQIGTSRVASLTIDSGKPVNVLVREIQREPLTGSLLHVDFYQLKATEKIKLEVPIHFIGQPLAEKNKKGLLLEQVRALEIECLPKDIPEKVEVDVSHLAEPGDAIHVSDLKHMKGVTILRDATDIIAKIEVIKVEAVPEKPPAAEAVAEAAPEEAGKPVPEQKPEKTD